MRCFRRVNIKFSDPYNMISEIEFIQRRNEVLLYEIDVVWGVMLSDCVSLKQNIYFQNRWIAVKFVSEDDRIENFLVELLIQKIIFWLLSKYYGRTSVMPKTTTQKNFQIWKYYVIMNFENLNIDQHNFTF